MGRKCCVPECRSNYNNTKYVPSFLFPKDETRKNLWIKSIHRKDFIPTATSVICINHFSEKFIIRQDSAVRKDGTVITVPRMKLKLTEDAYPTLYPNQPSYMSSEPPPKRRNPAERPTEIDKRDEDNFQKWLSKDNIASFDAFKSGFVSRVVKEWLYVEKNDYILFYKIESDDQPKMTVSFKIHCDLRVTVWHGFILLNIKSFQHILEKHNKCDRWTKFDCLINMLGCYSENNIPMNDKLSYALKILVEYKSKLESDEGKSLFYIDLMIEHFSLFVSKKHVYSPNYLLFSAKFYFSYPSAYTFIRNSKCLILPHPVYLKQLSSPCNSNSNINNSNHLHYLKTKTKLLSEKEKVVSLLLDEIYINSTISFKSGKIVGVADNSVKEATTIQAFMITSIFSKNKDVVALVPVKNQTADVLLSYTLKVLNVLKELNYTVLCLISDNNCINVNMFTKMCSGSLKCFIENPVQPDKKLFFLFDTVHLIKCVRNNWLKQTTDGQTFYYPNPDDYSVIFKASIKHLKDIYESEKEIIVKTAPKLSQKVLYPTSFEKQNVLYTLNLFHETNIAALSLKNENSGTKVFLELFLKWWKVVNVKHSKKGVRFNDNFCDPIESSKDKNVHFLKKFHSWLLSWEKLHSLELAEKKKLGLPVKKGILSKQTHFALQFTTKTLIALIDHIFNMFSPKYILLGKFQTDPLEARFGLYRQMSGGNYNVSCQQIFESESKLKILSWITAYSEKNGEINLKSLDFSQNVKLSKETVIPEILYETFNSSDLEINFNQKSVLIYISGFISSEVCKKINCKLCHKFLILEKSLDYEVSDLEIKKYLQQIDRGCLKWPTEFVYDIIVQTYFIFLKLISQKYEDVFLKCENQKCVLEQISFEKLDILSAIPETQCTCNNTLKSLAKHCLSIAANIFINNYVKVRNDKIKSQNTKRKLATLTI